VREPVVASGTATLAPAAGAIDAVKIYGKGDNEVRALNGVTVALSGGAFTAIMGPSGSGKSTLMHCLAGLDSLTSGSVYIGQTYLSTLDDKALTRLRRDKVGFVFQAYNLLPTLTAIENITLPLALGGHKPDQAWLDNIVKAVATRPEIIFADEPTGNLDSRSSNEILAFMRDAVKSLGQTIVMVTHDPNAASYADRVLFLGDGRIVDEIFDPTSERVLDRMKQFGD
jgi:putative ABC transport system ATP-binding protein